MRPILWRDADIRLSQKRLAQLRNARLLRNRRKQWQWPGTAQFSKHQADQQAIAPLGVVQRRDIGTGQQQFVEQGADQQGLALLTRPGHRFGFDVEAACADTRIRT